MTNEQFQILLDHHGADPARWPASERATAETLATHNDHARALLRSAQRLDAALMRHAQITAEDEAAVTRVLTRLASPLPRQKQPFWRLPAVLLDWQFAPAWPRVAALGACAVIGFAVGLSGLDYTNSAMDPFYGNTSGAEILFELEPWNGAQL